MGLSRMIKSLAVASLFSFTAHAGQQLHFQQGTINIQNGQVQASFDMAQESVSSTEYFIVQYKNHITNSDKKKLKAWGGQILRYIPDDAYLIKANSAVIAKLSQYPTVNGVIAYTSALKVSPQFAKENAGLTSKILVRVMTEQDLKAVSNAIANNGLGQVVFAKGQHVGLIAPAQAVSELARIEGVEWVEPYPKFEFLQFPLEKEWVQSIHQESFSYDGYETGTKVMNFDAAWGRGFTGRGQKVAFADTGLDSGDLGTIHRDFKNQIEKGYAYGLLSFSWNDPMGHGTHVAGSIASNGASSGGMVRGGAFESKLIAGGMWSQLLNNMFPPNDITVMFSDAKKDGARIHSNSWGSAQNLGAYDQFAQTVDEFSWNNPDMLVIFAAGNSGLDENSDGRVDQDSIGSPATAKNVLSVGASENKVSNGGIQRKLGDLKTQDGKQMFPAEPLASDYLSDDPNGIAAFSSRGPTDDGRIKPDIVAPGTNILSVRSQVKDASELWGCIDQDYCWCGGTSMATPLTAGAASVLRQYLATARGMSNPSAAMVKGLLMHTATDLYPGQYGNGGKASGQELLETKPNINQGFGLVDMDRATALDQDFLMDEANGVATGETLSYNVDVTGRAFITLTYTDAAAASGASRALVNNLDIRVLRGGQVLAEGSDSVNNFEYIDLPNATGTLTIEVRGTNVPTPRGNGKLPFALIVSSGS
ncbi:MAG: S8 family serine peptidase [Bdellovibrionales bacterium]|nr:S8 family serine peptidase [Bdellovibrionales bacterium]